MEPNKEQGLIADKNEDELWDLYTKDREKTGKCHRRGDRMKEGEYHLVVHVCIFNSKNQMLIQQRQPYKKGWPNMWDLTVGGSALKGESSFQAAERELFEELGIRIDLSEKRPAFTMNFENGFDDYYLIEQETDLSELCLQEEEVQCAKWADREEVLRMQKQGIMVPYWFMDKLFEIREGYDAHGKKECGIRVTYATKEQLESWMNLVEIVRRNFPGMETETEWEDYRNTVIRNMDRGSAVCALYGNMVVGVLLFSEKKNMLCCLAVHPDFRRQKIATKMIHLMLSQLDHTRDVTVRTFRTDDEKGIGPRNLYLSLGFVPGKLCEEFGYPIQEFTLKSAWKAE